MSVAADEQSGDARRTEGVTHQMLKIREKGRGPRSHDRIASSLLQSASASRGASEKKELPCLCSDSPTHRTVPGCSEHAVEWPYE